MRARFWRNEAADLFSKATLFVLVAAAAYSAPFGDSPKLTNYLTVTNFTGEKFLTISNCTYVQIGNSTLIRVTDSEWQKVTNHYSKFLQTNTLQFYR